MASTDHFKEVINDYLKQAAISDPLFAETLKKPGKNIDDCITYILNQVKKSGRFGFADDEVFNMAMHYYDEDDVKPGKKINATVVVNKPIEKPVVKLSEEEINRAKTIAMDKAIEEQRAKLTKKKKQTSVTDVQVTLFDL